MKAIVYHGKESLKYETDYPEPEITNENDVKIKVHYCGICGSDLKEYLSGPFFFNEPGSTNPISNLKFPMVMGHEISGEVVKVGTNVTEFTKGDKVIVEVTGSCKDKYKYFEDSPTKDKESCHPCQEGFYNCCEYLALTGLGFSDGGCAEFLVTTKEKLIKFDEDKIPMDIAALIQPLSVSWHAVEVGKFEPGQSALILGGGPIGLTTIFALKGHKAKNIVVSEPSLARRQLAEKLGVKVYDPTGKSTEQCIEDLKKMTDDGYGYHHSFDCSGVSATFQTSIKTLRIRGTATNVAVWAKKYIEYSPMETTMSEKIVTGSICFVKSDFEQVVDSIQKGDISTDELRLMISSKIKLSDGIDKGFLELIHHKERHIKILFTPMDDLATN